MRKKIIMMLISLTVLGMVIPVSTQAGQEEIENEGEVVDNPWGELFGESTTGTIKKESEKIDRKVTSAEGKIEKVKIVKKVTKKKKAKKIKIQIKKIKAVKGYQVYIYKNKSGAKKNRKALYKKTIAKNVKVLKVSSKKLSKKKKLYLKIRAYKLVQGKYVYGSWSKIVRVKVK